MVTFLQLVGDLASGDQAPLGYGHVYGAEHHVDSWMEVTGPPEWTEEGIRRLTEVLGEGGVRRANQRRTRSRTVRARASACRGWTGRAGTLEPDRAR
jgi:hypothetical protein